jgi:hypothetical protein
VPIGAARRARSCGFAAWVRVGAGRCRLGLDFVNRRSAVRVCPSAPFFFENSRLGQPNTQREPSRAAVVQQLNSDVFVTVRLKHEQSSSKRRDVLRPDDYDRPLPTTLEAVALLVFVFLPGYIAASIFARNRARLAPSEFGFALQILLWASVLHLFALPITARGSAASAAGAPLKASSAS